MYSRIILTIFLFCLSLFIEGQNLIISSGIKNSWASISVLDRRSGSGEIKTKSFHSSFDINFSIETKTNNSFSVKTGLYFNKAIYDYTIWNLERVPAGTVQWTNVYMHEEIPVIIVPLLLAVNQGKNEEKLRYHIDLGPYFGYRIVPDDETQNFNNFEVGGELAMGIGGKKWQMSFYLLTCFRNMAKSSSPLNLEKTTGTVLGVNLTRVISLKRKSATE